MKSKYIYVIIAVLMIAAVAYPVLYSDIKSQSRQQQSIFLRTARAVPKTTSGRYQLHQFLHCRT